MVKLFLSALMGLGFHCAVFAQDVIPVWQGKAPGETKDIGPEKQEPANPKDTSPVKRLSNVSTPTLTVLRPAKPNGTGVIVCPGGGHRILAWDKEGTEAGEWLNSLGITAFILKYRVPARDENFRYKAAVQDAQRAVSLIRSRAKDFGIATDRIGMLGFSAGGETAALTAIFEERLYPVSDSIDKVTAKPNFAILLYPGGLLEKDKPQLKEYVKATKNTPPMFFAHANDDKVSPLNSALLYAELKKFEIPSELHIFAKGGHGFGLRSSAYPASAWPVRCKEWMTSMGFLGKN